MEYDNVHLRVCVRRNEDFDLEVLLHAHRGNKELYSYIDVCMRPICRRAVDENALLKKVLSRLFLFKDLGVIKDEVVFRRIIFLFPFPENWKSP